MPNKSYITEPDVATGVLGDEASMLAHAASYGVTWRRLPRFPEPPPSTAVWREIDWPRWKMGRRPQKWTAADRDRLG